MRQGTVRRAGGKGVEDGRWALLWPTRGNLLTPWWWGARAWLPGNDNTRRLRPELSRGVPAGRPSFVAADEPDALHTLPPAPVDVPGLSLGLGEMAMKNFWVGDAANKAACALLSERQASERRDFKLYALTYVGAVVLG